MTDKQKLLELLKKASKLGKMPNKSGLCAELNKLNIVKDNFHLFTPSYKEQNKLHKEKQRTCWWGAESINNPVNKFTELRETVLCFLIAMED